MKLVRERGVSVSQAARDLDLHENVLRKWVREQVADPGSAFPGLGVMKPESQEMERLLDPERLEEVPGVLLDRREDRAARKRAHAT